KLGHYPTPDASRGDKIPILSSCTRSETHARVGSGQDRNLVPTNARAASPALGASGSASPTRGQLLAKTFQVRSALPAPSSLRASRSPRRRIVAQGGKPPREPRRRTEIVSGLPPGRSARPGARRSTPTGGRSPLGARFRDSGSSRR